MIEFSYQNKSINMVVLRCVGPKNFFLEKVLFPSEEIVLSVPNDSRLEIWGNELYGPKLEQRIRIRNEYKDNLIAA